MPKPVKNYQTLSLELDSVLSALQAPELDIDQALELYKRGQKLAKELETYLKTAENTVRSLGIQGVIDE